MVSKQFPDKGIQRSSDWRFVVQYDLFGLDCIIQHWAAIRLRWVVDPFDPRYTVDLGMYPRTGVSQCPNDQNQTDKGDES